MRFGAISCLLAAGVIIAPSCLPVLAPQDMERYGEVFGFLYKPSKVGAFAVSDFPTIIENRIGWDNLARTVAEVYSDLPEEEREGLGIYADTFGPAGAINYYGPSYGLPRAVSGHLNYYLWGPGYSWHGMIVVTQHIGDFRYFFGDIQQKAYVVNEHASPVGTDIGVYVCKAPLVNVNAMWMHLKLYR